VLVSVSCHKRGGGVDFSWNSLTDLELSTVLYCIQGCKCYLLFVCSYKTEQIFMKLLSEDKEVTLHFGSHPGLVISEIS